ncbi:hypothetical protein [Negadavirga shengliensis]|uniref:Exostosin family protein n=1 Tax=Negadavirga shengliensis TaxID=1389218 RepID=A0ABV9T3P8_9BACT
MKLFGYDNLHFDENSLHEFHKLNESLFIRLLFQNLEDVMGEEFNEYDFFIYSNFKGDTYPVSISYNSKRKKVLLYFSDESGSDPSPYVRDYYAVFKAYIGTSVKFDNVFPLPLGYVKDVPQLPIIPTKERKFNVFFRGNLNNNRIDFYRNFSKWKPILPSQTFLKERLWNKTTKYRALLLKLRTDFSDYFPDSIIMFNSSFKTGFSPYEYGEFLADSKIVLCPKGFDMTECFRHFEAMRAGCVIISEKLPETEFYKNSPIIQIEDWGKGLAIAKNLIDDLDTMAGIQQKTIKWWEEKCSEKGTAAYIYRKLQTLVPHVV